MEDKKGFVKNKILVVDDQVGIVSFLFDFFTHKGYEVSQATSGREAVQLVKKENPVLVLLDIRLGWGRDGVQVLKEIKEINPDVRVIMMTSVSDETVIEEAFNLGADDYIIKPFSLSYLEKVVMLKVLNMEIQRLGKGENEGQA
ncbi:MAG: response regulator [Candidatus Omnitrophota bacterium]|nr:response regulator [Candidatus Omnitrophota bacterium]